MIAAVTYLVLPAQFSQLRRYFTIEWLTTPLIPEVPEQHFIVALDPAFSCVNDPELFKFWHLLPRDTPYEANLWLQAERIIVYNATIIKAELPWI